MRRKPSSSLAKLKGLGLEGNLLVITDELTENLYLSSKRRLPNVLVAEAQEGDPVSLIRFAQGAGHQERRGKV